MTAREWMAEQFENHRNHLRGVAYRMLGSLSEADDAVQQAWLRLSRSDANDIENLGGWLTTVVARVSMDMLRSRESRREEPLDPIAGQAGGKNPEDETLLANSIGLALLVVLDTLGPAERLAFVLHDLFGMSFDEIAPIVERSPAAARQLASRARRRVQGARAVPDADLTHQREVVDAFLAASRNGDFDALLAVLDPDAVLRGDAAALRGAPPEIRGAAAIANRAIKGGARAAQPALVNGAVGVVVAPRGRLMMVLNFTVRRGKIVEIEAIGDPERLRQLDLAVL
ncbi:MAG TPA: sigma-70 family RNA polymerase sigma factor [Thermoanaerobaculia bacterium]|nr:sigma-70 family RNA polymerase sigma factor [Thermoanaerobaculia bacterium]